MNRAFFPRFAARLVRVLAAALGMATLGACGPAAPALQGYTTLPEAQAVLAWWVAAADGSGVRVRAFSGGAAPGTLVRVEGAGAHVEGTADALGRVDLRLGAAAETVHITIGEAAPVSFAVRGLDAARAAMFGPPVATGATLNSVVFTDDPCAAVWVVASTEGTLERHVLDARPDCAAPAERVSLVTAAAPSPRPWAVAADARGLHVSLFGADALVTRAWSTAEYAAAPLDAPLTVQPPRTLEPPLDVHGDGATQDTLDTMAARAPGAIAADGQTVAVAVTNLLRPALRPGEAGQYGPGQLALIDDTADTAPGITWVTLPADNPQAVWPVQDADGAGFDVVTTGPFAWGADGVFRAPEEGRIVHVRRGAAGWNVAGESMLGVHAPGRPVVLPGDRWLLGSTTSAEACIVARDAGRQPAQGVPVCTAFGDGQDALFEAAALGGGLYGITQFSTDRVHVYDADADAWDPWPFTGGLLAEPRHKRTAPRGLSGLRVRAGRPGVDHVGPSAVVRFANSDELRPMLWLALFGPGAP